jgi:tRNA nucleotidyltransferase/poly(A) polymerase
MPKIFKVGGCVRDAFLGINSKDIDFTFVLDNLDQTVESGFAEMEKWMTDQGFTIFLSVPEMFTIRAKFPIDHKFAKLDADFVMARKEIGYMEGTRRPILELGTLEDDLMRRDFTLNAMAEDVDGNIIDLFNGQEDLEMKLLRTPLDAKITMMDDPLRILRAIRFSITKGFLIHHTIFQAMEQEEILEKLRTTVSGERIREELFKMMKHDTVATIKLLTSIDQKQIPGLLDLIFANGLWLNPTFKHAK